MTRDYAFSSVVVFGAGSIGRGLIAPVLIESGFTPVFVEPMQDVRAGLKKVGRYTLHLTGRKPESQEISHFRILSTEDIDVLSEILLTCRFAATAVGGPHLHEVATLLAKTIGNRQDPLILLLCENWPNADQDMMHHLAEEGITPDRIVCVPSSVERMVRTDKGLDLVGESCETVYVESSSWPGTPPHIRGMHFVEHLEPYYKRKIFTNNAGHALLAYEGALKGCSTLCESFSHPDIVHHLQHLLEEAAKAVHAAYGLSLTELNQHIHNLMQYRYPNTMLGDTVARVGRQVLRKLGPAERLVGLLRLLEAHGCQTEPVHRAIAAALHYAEADDPESIQMQEMICQHGPGVILEKVCRIQSEEFAYKAILAHYERITASRNK